VAAVEFALILPMFMMLCMGTIDYGYYLYLDMTCTNAAREASRRGVVATLPADAQTDAVAAGDAFLAAAGLDSGINVPVVTSTTPVTPDFQVTSTVTLDPFTPIVGFLPAVLLPTGIAVTSTMRWELAPSP